MLPKSFYPLPSDTHQLFKDRPCHRGREGEDTLPGHSPSGNLCSFPDPKKYLFKPLLEAGPGPGQELQAGRPACLLVAPLFLWPPVSAPAILPPP